MVAIVIKKVGINIMIYGVVYGGLDLSGVNKMNNLKTNNMNVNLIETLEVNSSAISEVAYYPNVERLYA